MFPILHHEFIEKRGWITERELTDYYAIGQCTPGIIAVNVSTFVGNKRGGPLRGIIATLGFVTVPLVLLIAIAASLRSFAQVPVVRSAFAGIRVCVCVLIVNAVLRLWKNSVVDRPTLLLFAAALRLKRRFGHYAILRQSRRDRSRLAVIRRNLAAAHKG